MNYNHKRKYKNLTVVLMVLLILTYIVVLGSLSIGRHNAFASGFDLGNMDSTVWNTIQGRIFMLSQDGKMISRFSVHADLILILLSPLYFLWNNVRMLILSESVFLAIGAIPVYLLSTKILKNKLLSLSIVILYLLNPGMQWTDIYDFHGVSLAIPFLLFSFYFAYIKKWKWYAVFIFLALITKEQISLTVALFGLFIALVFKEKKVGLITFMAGILWFLLMVFVVMPRFSPEGKHWALSWYQFIDTTGIPKSLPTLKILLENFLFSPDAIGYYISLLKPFAFLPLAGLPWLVLALPELTVNMLSSHGQMRSIVFHYDSVITPWLVIATIFGLFYLQELFKKIQRTNKYSQYLVYGITLMVLLFALRFNYHYSPLPTTPSCWCFMYQPTKEDKEFEALLQKIPQDASITASPEIRPHTTHREKAFTLPVATASADFIALIDQNRMVGNYDPKDFELRLRDQLKTSKDYALVKHTGHFYLYKRADYKYEF